MPTMCVWNDDDGDEDDYVDNDDNDEDDYDDGDGDDDSAYFKVIIASISIQSVQFSPFQGRLLPLNVPIFCLEFSLRRHLKTHTGDTCNIFSLEPAPVRIRKGTEVSLLLDIGWGRSQSLFYFVS